MPKTPKPLAHLLKPHGAKCPECEEVYYTTTTRSALQNLAIHRLEKHGVRYEAGECIELVPVPDAPRTITSAKAKDRIVQSLLAGLNANGLPEGFEIISRPANQGAPRFILKFKQEGQQSKHFVVAVQEMR